MNSYYNIIPVDIINIILLNINRFNDYFNMYLYLLLNKININFEVLYQLKNISLYKVVKPILKDHPLYKLNNPWKILYEIIVKYGILPSCIQDQYKFYNNFKNLYNLISPYYNLSIFSKEYYNMNFSGTKLLYNNYHESSYPHINITINTYYINYDLLYNIFIYNTNNKLKIFYINEKSEALLKFPNYLDIFNYIRSKDITIQLDLTYIKKNYYNDVTDKINQLISLSIITLIN